MTHKGRVMSYQGDSFRLTAEVGNPSAVKGMRKPQESTTQLARDRVHETQRASKPLLS